MDFERLQTNWANLGRDDPLWAILSAEGTEGGRWDPDAFLQSGRDFIAYLTRQLTPWLDRMGRRRALDFGCGYGRLTQALAEHFEEAVGIDIAPAMLDGARRWNRHGARVRYERNAHTDLRQLPDAGFDFVLSSLVLQHMRPDYAEGYLAEFVRVLRPGGLAFFQVPWRTRVPQPPTPAGAPGTGATTVPRGLLTAHPRLTACTSGDWYWLLLRATNHRDCAWPHAGAMPWRVRSRWQRLEGTPIGPVRHHDLPGEVAPGATVELLVPVQMPAVHGELEIAFQLGAGEAWRCDVDLPPARMPIHVLPRRSGTARGAPPPPPVAGGHAATAATAAERHIEMHTLPIARVVAVVEAAGGEVLDVGEDDWAGPNHLSAHYTVRRR